jgi:hypothetical protein
MAFTILLVVAMQSLRARHAKGLINFAGSNILFKSSRRQSICQCQLRMATEAKSSPKMVNPQRMGDLLRIGGRARPLNEQREEPADRDVREAELEEGGANCRVVPPGHRTSRESTQTMHIFVFQLKLKTNFN